MTEYEGPTVADLSNAEEARAQLQALRERRIKATGGGKTRMTDYIILARTDTGTWIEMDAKQHAPSAKAAIKEALDGAKLESAEFVAVPVRSWQPVKVEVETALKFS